MKRAELIRQLRTALNRTESQRFANASFMLGQSKFMFVFEVFTAGNNIRKLAHRATIIEQLRSALNIAESPDYDTVEFDLHDTNLVFELDSDSSADCACDDLGSECPTCEVEQ